MSSPIQLTKADVRRALAIHHFTPCRGQMEAFERLRSVQFDPIAPVGCNQDLVLQARVPAYKVGDWSQTAYVERKIYDGWDKQASLIPFEGWPLRRLIHGIHRKGFEKKIFEDHKDGVDAVMGEIADRGPLQPKDFEFQQRRDEWKGSWHGPNVTKQILRALWHSGIVMTAGRKNGQHVYDLTERVVLSHILNQPRLPDADAKRELALERYRAMGLVRPNAGPEIWSYSVMSYEKKELVSDLAEMGKIVPVEVEGVKAHALPEFLALLDQPSLESQVTFIAPLDPFMWDRKMTAHIYAFDYAWEIYTPPVKRRWGYYVLPILFGNDLVARAEFSSREGVLNMLQWHDEGRAFAPAFSAELERALRKLMAYCSATTIRVAAHIDPKIRNLAGSIRPGPI